MWILGIHRLNKNTSLWIWQMSMGIRLVHDSCYNLPANIFNRRNSVGIFSEMIFLYLQLKEISSHDELIMDGNELEYWENYLRALVSHYLSYLPWMHRLNVQVILKATVWIDVWCWNETQKSNMFSWTHLVIIRWFRFVYLWSIWSVMLPATALLSFELYPHHEWRIRIIKDNKRSVHFEIHRSTIDLCRRFLFDIYVSWHADSKYIYWCSRINNLSKIVRNTRAQADSAISGIFELSS